MPTNLPLQYFEIEKKLKTASSTEGKKEVDLNNLRNYMLQDKDLIELGKRSSFFEFRFLLSSRELVNKIEIKIKRKIAIKNVIKTDLGIER